MAIKFVLAMDHFGTVSGVVTPYLGGMPLGAFLVGGSSKNSLIQGGQLSCLNTTGTEQFYWTLQTSTIASPNTWKSFWGGRVTLTGGLNSGYTSNAATALVYVGSGSTSYISVFTPSDLPGYPNLAGTNVYLELSVNYSTGEIERWVNNVKIASLTLSAANIANVATRAFTVGFNASILPSQQGFWRDMYFLDDTRDATPCGRLGPQKVVPVNYGAAAGTNWTFTTGPALINDLNSPLTATGSTLTTPTVSVPAPGSPMTMSSPSDLSAIPNNGVISGVLTCYAPSGAASHKVSVQLDVGGSQSVADVQAPTSSIVQCVKTAPVYLPPGGGVWNKTKLGTLKQIIQAA